ncbi:MAG: 50S ribosomal protein L11 methyltransferase [Candidatus Syntrophopropionicum ammoniitolerans]
MKWLEITVCVPVEGTEPLTEIFIEMGLTGGVAIEDPALISAYEREIHPDEWAVPKLETAEGTALVRAYIPLGDGWSTQLAEIKKVIGRLGLQMPPKISTRFLEEEDWAHAWKKYYKPLHVGRRLVIKPSWEDYRLLAGDLVIELDPGMAFGSGPMLQQHSAWNCWINMCIQAVVYTISGTGSGILAIAAAKLGAGRVQAVDIDPVACKVAVENVAVNHVDSVVSVRQGNPAELFALRGRFGCG